MRSPAPPSSSSSPAPGGGDGCDDAADCCTPRCSEHGGTPGAASGVTCAVCLSPVWHGARTGRRLFRTACGHSFHRACVAGVRAHRLAGCPLCRTRLESTGLTPQQVAVAAGDDSSALPPPTVALVAARSDTLLFANHLRARARTAREAVRQAALLHASRPVAASAGRVLDLTQAA